MKERGIEEKDIKQCLIESGAVSPIVDDDAENVAAKRLDGKVLIVIYRKTGDIYFVVTAFASSKVEKYLP